MMDSAAEFQESKSITFEWTLRGLKSLFESRCATLNGRGISVCRRFFTYNASSCSKGEAKSKVTKSVKFGGGKWQV